MNEGHIFGLLSLLGFLVGGVWFGSSLLAEQQRKSSREATRSQTPDKNSQAGARGR